jgi:outer membrane lipoprotein-sorting protein
MRHSGDSIQPFEGDTISRMSRWLPVIAVAAIVSCGAMQTAAQAQSAEELVSKNLTAKGGVARLKSVPGFRIMARVLLPTAGLEFPAVITTKRPNRFYQESTIRGTKVIAGYDGEKGWILNPLMGGLVAQEMQGSRLEMLKRQLDLEGPLVDYKAKGTTVEVAGHDSIEGKPVTKLKVTPKDGFVEYFYVDDETGLEAKTIKQIKDGDGVTTLETRYSNYQPVDGVMLPHIVEQKAAGQVLTFTIEKVEIANSVDDTLFKMPDSSTQASAQSPK